ncbi:VanZ family protein [Hymenobacter wooponensis]|uniref:VanZ family protein n=1 Tax=Hymenobacter wooponensis TaxID=1525360 RepID=A0A4Z0MNM8_9BACT|nr:VanZ family protein [Hymenobacter wooponensis]TGD81512.1 VanZ family protein [Hymenobacter wooponensis]
MLRTAPPLPRRRAFVALPLAWAALVLVLTLTPSEEMPKTPDWQLLSFDTAAHAGVFTVLAVLAYFSAGRQESWLALRRHALGLVLLACIAFGAIIEILQMTMKLGRHGEWSDLISDTIGAGIGLGLMYVTRRFWR